jgi:HD-like signal output (HDOD) protein
VNTRQAILDRVPAIEALPVVAMRVITTLQNPRAELSEIARLIRHDPALTAGLLRLANSAAMAGRHRIESVDAALARIGLRKTLHLVMSTVVAPIAARPVRGYDLPAGELWRHNVAAALGANVVYDLIRRPPHPAAFTAGLLLDIGKQILGEFMEVDGRAIQHEAFEQHVSFEQAERHVLGIDHAQVGAALLTHWGLPDSIVDVVRWHHEPASCPPDHREVAQVVHVADQVCTQAGIGGGADGCNYVPCAQTLEQLGITPEVVERATCRIVEQLQQLDDFMLDSAGAR